MASDDDQYDYEGGYSGEDCYYSGGEDVDPDIDELFYSGEEDVDPDMGETFYGGEEDVDPDMGEPFYGGDEDVGHDIDEPFYGGDEDEPFYGGDEDEPFYGGDKYVDPDIDEPFYGGDEDVGPDIDEPFYGGDEDVGPDVEEPFYGSDEDVGPDVEEPFYGGDEDVGPDVEEPFYGGDEDVGPDVEEHFYGGDEDDNDYGYGYASDDPSLNHYEEPANEPDYGCSGLDNSTMTTNQNTGPITNTYELTTKSSNYDNQTGSYIRGTVKDSYSSGDYSNHGRTGYKDEYKSSSTLRVGDKRGYTEYFKQEKETRVEYNNPDTYSGAGKSYNYNGGGGVKTYRR